MNNKIIYLTIVALLITPVLFSPSLLGLKDKIKMGNIEEQSLTVTLRSAPYTVSNISNGKTKINMEGFSSMLTPGLPKLPAKTFLVGLPPRSQVMSVKLTDENHMFLKGKYDVVDASPFSSGTKDESYPTDKKTSPSYSYPSTPYDYLGTGQLGKYTFAKIRFYPLSYCPLNGKLTLYENISLEIHYRKRDDGFNIKFFHPPTERMASEIIVNYQSISPFYTTKTTQFPQEHFPYVIITTTNLQHSVLFLKNWREITTESPVKIVNISWITSTYEGNDIAEKIRTFLKDKYSQWMIKNVLIVGSDKSIPMRDCYPNKDDHSDTWMTPTDYYYADLTGKWDKDGDGFYGERNDDSPDFYPEVFVGRIPFDDQHKVKDICQKIIEFEQNDNQWKKKALLLGAILTFKNEDHKEDYDKTDGATLMEILKYGVFTPNTYTVTTMYEKQGKNSSIYSCDHPLNRENVKTYWSQGYGIVNWNAHGSPWSSKRRYWEYDDGDNIPEDREIYMSSFITSDDTVYLNEDKPSIVFSCACNNAHPDYSDNLGVSLLNKGAVAFIGSTSIAWIAVGWEGRDDGGIQTIDYDFFDFLVNQGYPCGESLYKALQRYITQYDWWSWKIYQNMYDFCLYGDPATSFKTFTSFSPPNKPEEPSGMSQQRILTETVFSTYTEDPDGHQVYYKWDWGDGIISDWMGPYNSHTTIQASHMWNKPGDYEVRVKACDIIGAESNWSKPFTIHITAPEVQIEKITGGFGRVKVVVTNNGGADAKDVQWYIKIDRMLFTSRNEGIITTLQPDESTVIKSDFQFGFGLPAVTVGLIGGEQEVTTRSILIGPFIIIL